MLSFADKKSPPALLPRDMRQAEGDGANEDVVSDLVRQHTTICRARSMLTRDEAVTFLQNVLHIDEPQVKAGGDKLQLLLQITQNFQRYVPFQNLGLLELDEAERCIPTSEDIRKDCLTGIGGLCYSLGTFAKALLQALGYDAFLVSCSIPNTGRTNTHVTTVARNVETEGDAFLVELGAGFPTFEPVPLHELPKNFHHAFLQYKFTKEGSVISRWHRTGSQLGRLPTAVDPEGWQKFYEFELIPRSVEFLHPYQEPVYTQPGYAAGWYLMGLKMSMYPEGKALSVSDHVLKVWDQATDEMQTLTLESSEELEAAIQKHFPPLKDINIKKAIATMKREKQQHSLKQTAE